MIGGPAFVFPVDDPGELAHAIRQTLVLEIAGTPPRLIAAAAAPPDRTRAPAIDCLTGEKLRPRWLDP